MNKYNKTLLVSCFLSSALFLVSCSFFKANDPELNNNNKSNLIDKPSSLFAGLFQTPYVFRKDSKNLEKSLSSSIKIDLKAADSVVNSSVKRGVHCNKPEGRGSLFEPQKSYSFFLKEEAASLRGDESMMAVVIVAFKQGSFIASNFGDKWAYHFQPIDFEKFSELLSKVSNITTEALIFNSISAILLPYGWIYSRQKSMILTPPKTFDNKTIPKAYCKSGSGCRKLSPSIEFDYGPLVVRLKVLKEALESLEVLKSIESSFNKLSSECHLKTKQTWIFPQILKPNERGFLDSSLKFFSQP